MLSGAEAAHEAHAWSVYTLYLDNELVGQQANVALDIKLSTMHVGIQPPGWRDVGI
jgi:hypothetical protein